MMRNPNFESRNPCNGVSSERRDFMALEGAICRNCVTLPRGRYNLLKSEFQPPC